MMGVVWWFFNLLYLLDKKSKLNWQRKSQITKNKKFKDIDDLESIQRYYTKRIIGCSKLTYEERLQKLKLPSLAYRRMRGDLIEAYKITHNFYDPLTTKQFFNFYSDSNSSTRTNGFKMIKLHTNTTNFQHFFTNRVTNKWNSLPAHIVSADTINTFKNFVNIMYTIRVNYNRVDFSISWMIMGIQSKHEVKIKMFTAHWPKAKERAYRAIQWYDMIWYDTWSLRI